MIEIVAEAVQLEQFASPWSWGEECNLAQPVARKSRTIGGVGTRLQNKGAGAKLRVFSCNLRKNSHELGIAVHATQQSLSLRKVKRSTGAAQTVQHNPKRLAKLLSMTTSERFRPI